MADIPKKTQRTEGKKQARTSPDDLLAMIWDTFRNVFQETMDAETNSLLINDHTDAYEYRPGNNRYRKKPISKQCGDLKFAFTEPRSYQAKAIIASSREGGIRLKGNQAERKRKRAKGTKGAGNLSAQEEALTGIRGEVVLLSEYKRRIRKGQNTK